MHDLRKIVPISPMPNICTRFVQDCTYFPNAQYMHKICARLYLFPQCAIYAQHLQKIVLLSPMCNICARFAQDCTYFHNAQYMRKIVLISPMCNICTRLYLFPQCVLYAQDCRHYWKKYVTYHISVLNLEWYSFIVIFGLPQALPSFLKALIMTQCNF